MKRRSEELNEAKPDDGAGRNRNRRRMLVSALREHRDVLVVAAIAFAFRLLYFLEYSSSPYYEFLQLDSLYYYEWAVEIASGKWLGGDVFEQSPLYPYLLGVFLLVFGPKLTLLRLIQFAVGSVTAALTCALGQRIFGRSAGLVAGIGAALYGPFLFYEGQVMKEFLTPLFSMGTLLCLYAALQRRSAPDAGTTHARVLFAFSGFLIGAAALVRDNFLLLLPLLSAFTALAAWDMRVGGVTVPPPTPKRARRPQRRCARQSRWNPARQVSLGRAPLRRRLFDAAVMIAGALLALLPATAHNYAVSGQLVLTTSGGGEVFYIGNGPYANGAYMPPPWVRPSPRYEHEDFRQRAREITGRPLTRSEASRFWWAEGLRSIRANLPAYPRLLLRKALLFFNDHELADNYSYNSFRRFARTLAAAPTFGWAAVLAGPGLILSLPRWRQLLPLYIAGAGYTASVMLFFNFARFRLPFIPVLLLFSGYGAAALWALATRRERRGSAVRGIVFAAAAAGSFALVTARPPVGLDDPIQDRLHLGEAYREAGRSTEAEQVFREVIEDAEQFVASRRAGSEGATFALALRAAHKGLAGALLDQGRAREALEGLSPLIRADPQDAELFEMLGTAQRAEGDPGAAIEAYRRALAIAPDAVAVRFGLAAALFEAGDAPEALAELLRTKDETPNLAGPNLAAWHYAMGRTLDAMPDHQAEAQAHFREALWLDPAHPQASEIRRRLGAEATQRK